MYAVSPAFLEALRFTHTMQARVDVYYNGNRIITDLPFTSGEVTVNSGGDGVQRTLSLTVADPTLWDELAPVGAELYAYRGVRYPDGKSEMVPLGVFGLDSQQIEISRSGGIDVGTCPDRWARIQRARFELPESSVPTATCIEEIARLLRQAMPVTVKTQSKSSAKAGALVWDRDRDTAITDLAKAAGVEVYFDVTGSAVIRDVPTLTPPGVWTVDTGYQGVMLSGNAARDRSRVYNVVVVSSSATDGSAPFKTQVVADTDPSSVTYVGGPFGRVPFFFSSPILTEVTDAVRAARTLLNKVRGRYVQISATSIVNPALERGDTVGCMTADGNVNLFVLDGFNIPLTADGTQNLSTRSLIDIPEEAS